MSNHILSSYEEQFNKNSISLTSFNINSINEEMDGFFSGRRMTSPSGIRTDIELTFGTYNEKAGNPETLFYLILDALFKERYGIDLKEFENNYPDILI